jgi:basic amino acid/polyamine antiporter, APA family
MDRTVTSGVDTRSTPVTPGLVRGVGVAAMTAVMINAIIGAGIFGLPSRIHGIAGPHGLIAFLGCAVVVAAIGLCFGEVSSRFRETGGPYLYTRHAFGPVVAFVIGWLMWVTRITAVAAIANVMISYLSVFWPAGGAGLGRSLVIAAAVAAWTAIIASGVRQSAATAVAFTIGKLIPLTLFIAVGLFALDTRAFALGTPPEPGRFAEAILLLIFAFGGFEGVVVLAGESKNPRRDLPLALLGGLSVVTVFYVLIQVVCVGTLPNLADSTRPLADAAARFLGAGAFIVTVGALISTSGTMFAAMFSGPRVLYAMAEQGQLPAPFGAAHPRTHTPLLAIGATSVASLLLAVTGTFASLASLSAITRVLIYVGTAGALIVLRRRPDMEPAQVRVPGGTWVAALAIAACGWMLTSIKAKELRDVAIAIGIGLLLYAAHWATSRGRAKPRPVPEELR